MGFLYSAPQDAQAVSTAIDLYLLTVATDKPIVLHAIYLAQTTDLGDTNEEVLRFGIYRGVTGGGGGTDLTEVALNDLSPTAGTAVDGQGTASTGGTLIGHFYWNIRQAGPIWLPTPEMRPRISAANDPVAVRLLAQPADAITLSSDIIWEEL